MPDIHHDFPIGADPRRVFEALSSPAGLDQWWTKLELTQADADWKGTRVSFEHGERVAYEQRLDV